VCHGVSLTLPVARPSVSQSVGVGVACRDNHRRVCILFISLRQTALSALPPSYVASPRERIFSIKTPARNSAAKYRSVRREVVRLEKTDRFRPRALDYLYSLIEWKRFHDRRDLRCGVVCGRCDRQREVSLDTDRPCISGHVVYWTTDYNENRHHVSNVAVSLVCRNFSVKTELETRTTNRLSCVWISIRPNTKYEYTIAE